jgi:hypothetical protein
VSIEGARTQDTTRLLTVALGFKNTGQKAASGVLINVVLPRFCTDFQRSTQAGEATTSTDPATTTERLSDSQGVAHLSHYRSWVEDHVWRTHNYVRWFRFGVGPA